jgi:hypothetical protein
VDKFYAWKGLISTIMFIGMAVVLGMTVVIVRVVLVTLAGPAFERPLLLVCSAACLLLFVALPAALVIWLLRKECFAYTHYPIRLNRKTRTVHVFRIDGSVLSVPWDKVFFCLGRCHQPRHWEIQGHVLAEDKTTVIETFALSVYGVGDRDRELLKHHWEFVRRYVEDGAQSVVGFVHFCLPIDRTRESLRFGFQRMFVDSTGFALPLRLFWLLTNLIILPGRWFAMRTSKVPVWPNEIEDICPAEPGDPYMKDARINPPDLR